MKVEDNNLAQGENKVKGNLEKQKHTLSKATIQIGKSAEIKTDCAMPAWSLTFFLSASLAYLVQIPRWQMFNIQDQITVGFLTVQWPAVLKV